MQCTVHYTVHCPVRCLALDTSLRGLPLRQSSPMAAVAAQLTNAFNLLPETECCGLYAAKALINHSRDP